MSEEKRIVSAVIAGVGGYGGMITGDVLDHLNDYRVRVAGVVDPFYAASPQKERLDALGIPHYDTLEEFYAADQAELAILCTPIQYHEAHAACAMAHGSDVLIEKPAAATPAQAKRMMETAGRCGKTVNVGFQLSYMSAILRLKEDILSGRFGAPKDCWSLVLWPRNSAYYARSWAGRFTLNGQYVLDSIAMNACAHHLHILYFLLGSRMDSAAMPEREKVLLMRVNDIETFDTAMMEIEAGGATLHYLVSHAVPDTTAPILKLHFEKADILIQGEGKEEDAVTAVLPDGSRIHYGDLTKEYFRKVPYTLDVVRGLAAPVCTIETAMAQLLSVSAATFEAPVLDLRANLGKDSAAPRVYVKNDVRVADGLSELMKRAYDEEKMPWALTDIYGAPQEIALAGYLSPDERCG